VTHKQLNGMTLESINYLGK